VADVRLFSILQYMSCALSIRIQQTPSVALTKCNNTGDAFTLQLLKEPVVFGAEPNDSPIRDGTQYGANRKGSMYGSPLGNGNANASVDTRHANKRKQGVP
jgi:hypothetical protein